MKIKVISEILKIKNMKIFYHLLFSCVVVFMYGILKFKPFLFQHMNGPSRSLILIFVCINYKP